jgi:hypothetical protein
MRGSSGARLRRAAIAAALLLAACGTQHPFVSRGSPGGLTVTHSNDIEGATAVARRYCAGYERVPHLLDSTMDQAYFECRSR